MNVLTSDQHLSTLRIDASSIPHFLHWDLAYLWMLRQHPQQVPPQWQQRLQLWRKLLHAFLAGKLRVREHEVEPTILPYLRPYGIKELSLLEYEGRIVGLLSPVVILRPLPDGEPELPPIRREEYPAMAQALFVLIEDLNRLRDEQRKAGNGEAARALESLLKILGKEREQLGERAKGTRLEQVAHTLLLSIPYFGQDESAAVAVEVNLYYRQMGSSRPQPSYVPRCSSCQDLLTRDRTAATDDPCHVEGDVARIACQACSFHTEVPLSEFFIWFRNSGGHSEYVVWKDRAGFVDVPEGAAFPPEAKVAAGHNSLIEFEWNAGEVGDSARRFLILKIDHPVRCASVLDDALYRRFLDLGQESREVRGLPIRWGWLDVADAPNQVRAERTPAGVSFRNLGIRGLPFRFTKFYGVNARTERNTGLAMFPGPEIHNQWKSHRIFLTGACPDLRIRAKGVALTSDSQAMECFQWPEGFAVESEDGRTGVSFFLEPLPEATLSQARLRVGLDFGTTNTVVYFASPDDQNIETEKNAIHPSWLPEIIHWLARPLQLPERLWWLPTPALPGNVQDPCLIPSSVWVWRGAEDNQNRMAIRWHETPPCDGAIGETGFKWDDGLKDRSDLRIGFLQELFFWSIPLLLRRSSASLKTAVALDACATFPLSFPYPHRKKMEQALQSVAVWVRDQLGHTLTFSRLDESRAAVRVLGKLNPEELTLVADLGGRTLDVVLFRMRNLSDPPEIIQVGSIDLGGELFVEKLADKDPKQAWQYRDQIFSGQAAALAMAPGASVTVGRIHRLAFEVIRTMIAAHRKRDPECKIDVLLIGNGWRLQDLFAGAENPESHLLSWARRLARNTGLPRVEITPPPCDSISSSKHFVAVGALMHMADLESAQEHDQAVELAKLPAGRRIEIPNSEIIEWFELVGDGGRTLERVSAVNSQGIIIDANTVPELAETWKGEIEDFLNSLPEEAMLRDWLYKAISQEKAKILKGPLQLLIEQHWKMRI